MPSIPAISDFTGAGITEGEFKAALTGLHAYLSGAIGTAGTQAATLAAMGALIGAGTLTKSGAYTVMPADRGKIVECTGTWTLTLPDAAAVGDGFAVVVANVGVGAITIDPYSSQTIDGQSAKVVGSRQTVICTASSGNWIAVSGGGSLGLLRVTTYTASATWVKPSDCRAVYVEVKGGGGAGGQGATGSYDPQYGGEGGAGGGEGSEESTFTADPAGSYVVTVGGSGGTSSFGALVSAVGGTTGRPGVTAFTYSGGHGGTGCGPGGGRGGVGGSLVTGGSTGTAGKSGLGSGGGGGGGGGVGISSSTAIGYGGAGGSGYVRVFEFG